MLTLFLFLQIPESRALLIEDSHLHGPTFQLSDTLDWTLELVFEAWKDDITIIDNQPSTAGLGFMLFWYPNGDFVFRVNGGTNQDFVFPGVIEVNKPYHLAITYDYDTNTGLGDMYWYLNGEQYVMGLQVDYDPPIQSTAFIGKRDSSSASPFWGLIDYIHMTQELLYDGDFCSTYVEPEPSTNSIFLANFNDFDGGPLIHDLSSNNHDLTNEDCQAHYRDTIDLRDGFARLNGRDSKLTLQNLESINGDLTVEMDIRLMKRHGELGEVTLFDFIDDDPNGEGGIALKYNETNQIFIVESKVSGDERIRHVVAGTFPFNQWMRIAFCVDFIPASFAKCDLYVDGTRVFLKVLPFTPHPAGMATFGASRDDSGHTFGHFDQIRISTRALYSGDCSPALMDYETVDPDILFFWDLASNSVQPSVFYDTFSNAELIAQGVENAQTLTQPFWESPNLTPPGDLYTASNISLGDDWTLEFWVNSSSTGSTTLFHSFDEDLMKGMRVTISPMNQLFLESDGLSGLMGVLPQGWNHVVINQRFNPITHRYNQRGFINGSIQQPFINLSQIQMSGPRLVLAQEPNGDNALVGSMNNVRLSTGVRYTNGFPIPYSRLGVDAQTLALWDVEGMDGADILDETDQDHHFYLCSNGAIPNAGRDQRSCTIDSPVLLNGSVFCGNPTQIQWQGPGTIQSPSALVTEVIPPATPGTYTYTITFDGQHSDSVDVEVFDFGPAILIGFEQMNEEWPTLVTPELDIYPNGGDGFLDIRDLIQSMLCEED